MGVRRKCFVSYHHADQAYVDTFIRTHDHANDCFIARGLGREMPGDVVGSRNTDYVMSRIRQLYISDSTVTIVMLGANTWRRRYVDWEIASSLRRSSLSSPNGLIGIKLPTFSGKFPYRLDDNLIAPGSTQADCYARWYDYGITVGSLEYAIEEAYQRRTSHSQWIRNSRERLVNNIA